MRISDWSSDVCSSDLATVARLARAVIARLGHDLGRGAVVVEIDDNGILILAAILQRLDDAADALVHDLDHRGVGGHLADLDRALFGGHLVPGDVGVAGIARGQIGLFGSRRAQTTFALLLVGYLYPLLHALA